MQRLSIDRKSPPFTRKNNISEVANNIHENLEAGLKSQSHKSKPKENGKEIQTTHS